MKIALISLTLASVMAVSPAFARPVNDLQCNECVDTQDIASGAVTAAKLAPNTVSTEKIQDGAVTIEKLDPEIFNSIPQSGAREYVGNTLDTFNGGRGVATYTNACNAEYEGSRMCTSEEFLNTGAFPEILGAAWIRPTFVPVADTSTSSQPVALDMSGQSGSVGSLSCDGWNSNSGYGLLVDLGGRFRVSVCSTVYAVACCR